MAVSELTLDDLDAHLVAMRIPRAMVIRAWELVGMDAPLVVEVAAFAREQPAVEGRLMRAANLPDMTGGAVAADVLEAVRRLGTPRASRLALAVIMARHFPGALPCYGLAPERFWRHAVLTALRTEEAAARRRRSKGAAFAAGLLHGLGRHILARHCRRWEFHPDFRIADFQGLLHAEGELLEMNHAAAGGHLLQWLGFPPEVAEPVRWQGHPSFAGNYTALAGDLAQARAGAWAWMDAGAGGGAARLREDWGEVGGAAEIFAGMLRTAQEVPSGSTRPQMGG